MRKKDKSKTLLFDMDTKNNLNKKNFFFLNIIDGLNECSGRIYNDNK